MNFQEFADIKEQYIENYLMEETNTHLGNGAFSNPSGTIFHFKFQGMNNPEATKFIARVKSCGTNIYQVVTRSYKQLIEIHIENKNL
jgi:hypothetical protein